MKLSASSVSRVDKCPGSWHLENKIPYADRFRAFEGAANFGSAVHAAGEALLNAYISGEKLSIIKALKADGIDKNHLDFERANHAANEYKKYFTKVYKRNCKKFKKVSPIIEEKFRTNIAGVDCVFKCDAMLLSHEEGTLYIDIFDLKTGNFDYSDGAHKQMEYSVRIILAKAGAKYKEVSYTTHTVQPNYYEQSRWFVADTNYTTAPESLEYFTAYIEELKNNIEYNTGSHCGFCGGIAHCPKVRNIAEISSLFALANEDLTMVPPEQLEHFFLMQKPVETFFKAVAQRLGDIIDAGGYLNKVFRKKTSGNRYWIDKAQAAKTLSYLGDELYKPREIKTPAQIEKLAGKKNIEELINKPDRFSLAERVESSPFDKVGD